jgi:uncharacterized membrane protein
MDAVLLPTPALPRREWLLKRNCSLSPRQSGWAYALLCVASLFVALPFTLRGAWYVLAFACIEILALAIALLHYARHAGDHEHIALEDGCLMVECVLAGAVEQTRLDPCWTRVVLPRRAAELILLEQQGVRVPIGRFLTDARRRQVAQELRRELQQTAMARPGM